MAAEVALARRVLRTLLGLPSPLLRLMSGGGVVYRAGRTLDPRLQFLAARARKRPPLNTFEPPQARRLSARFLAAMSEDAPATVAVEALRIEGPAGTIPLRAYVPEGQDPAAPLMVYVHSGGGVIGDLETSDAFCGLLAERTGGPVLSVDYRLAPEHRFPAGLEDVLAAFRWGRDNAARFGAPPGQAAIGGDSIGGTFAAVACQELRQAGEPQPVLQLLIHPAVDMASQTASMSQFGDAFPLTAGLMSWFIGHYVGPGSALADPRLSPLNARDMAGLAPAIVATAGFDALVDQGEAYARRLQEAGARVTYRCYDSLCHGFVSMTGVIPAAAAACREIADLVRASVAEASPARR